MGPDWNKFLEKGVDNRKRIKDLYEGKVKGADEILVLTDYQHGKRSKVHQFASDLTIPQSVLPYKNGVFVAQGSELIFLDDTDRDGKADKRTTVLSGFGIDDSHTMAHSLVRGPGNWIHFSQGALNRGNVTAVQSGKKIPMNYSKTARFSLDGSQLELINSGLNNIWGYQLRSNGEWYQQEANDSTYSATPAEIGTGFRGIGNQRLRSYQPIRPPLHRFSVGGTGISGLAFSDDTSGGFPREWKDVGFIANPITSKINCVKIVRNPDGTITAEHLPDFLTSTDDWFRPVNLEFGPDGCLYIADWYNQVISHGEVPLNHPGRDKEHGRIWRIRPVDHQAQPIPNLYNAKAPELVNHLKSPLLWQKRAAWHQIADRPSAKTKPLAPALAALASDSSQETSTRVHAVWSLESIGYYDEKLTDALLVDQDDAVQRETLRSLAYLGLKPEQIASKIRPFLNSPNVKLRSQAIRTLDELNAANLETVDILVSFCRPILPGNALGPEAFKDKRNHVFRAYANQTSEVVKPMGGPYERSFERYLARKALEKYPEQLEAYLKSDLATKQPAGHLVWAMQALGDKAAPAFADIWNQIKDKELDTSNLIIISNMAKHQQVYQTVLPKFKDPKNAKQIVQLSLDSLHDVYTPAFAKLLEHPVSHLLTSGKDTESQKKALQVIQKFNPPVNPGQIAPHLKGPNASDAILALAQNPKENKDTLTKVLDDPKTSQDLWLLALPAFAKADLPKAQTFAAERLKKEPAIKSPLITALGSSANGTNIIMNLTSSKLITPDDISFDIADRILGANRKFAHARAISKHAQDKRKAAHQANLKRLPDLVKLAEKKGGNPTIGKSLFQGMCLACHTAGGEGGGLAPALDGSSNRSTEGVLSAILDPDAAIEGAYVLYRVYTKSGDIIDGYRVSSNTRGTIVSTPGTTRFVPAHDISRAGYIGRSFMSFGLISDQTPDEVVEHLLSYIRSMK